mgnify:CR=1 FL=1|jgi:DNA-directed RNA polymerase subunit H (RpoH/RPB5)
MEQTINSSHFNNLYKCRKNLLEILDKIGYDISAYQLFDMNELYSMIQNEQINFHLKKRDKTNKCGNVQIHFYELLGKTSKALRDKNVDELIEHYYYIQNVLSENDRLIIIVNDDPNDTLTQHLKHQWEKNNLLVNIISLKRLQFNILKHNLVPPHRILLDEEKVELMEKYNIREMKQIPEISRFDPVSQVLGIRPNDICEIIRPSKHVIQTKYYRVGVNY